MEKIPVKPNIIGQMIPLQVALIKEYQVLEGLPPYPVNLQDKKGQKLIKDFVRRIVEELSEAYEELGMAFDCVQNNSSVGDARTHIKAYNAEMADAWHFIMELLIYSGFEDENLDNMVKSFIGQYPQYENFYSPERPFKTLLNIAGYLNFQEDKKTLQNRPDRFVLATMEEVIQDSMFAGARKISQQLFDIHAQQLWDITFQLNKLANILKNREWNQAERVSNELQYANQMVYVFLALAIYMDFAGFGEIDIVNNYWAMNQKNHKRIKDGY